MTSFSPQVLSLIEEIQSHADPVVAEHSQRYFKTGPGEYGEGDVFIGVRVPVVRAVGKNFRDLSPAEIVELAQSPIHELRLCAVQVLAGQFKRSKNLVQQGELFDVYLGLVAQGRVNNWDLVDSCAPYLGGYLTSIDNSIDLLSELASSANLWERRSAVMFTAALIRQGIFDPTVRLCEMLLGDSHDLIHKATGWMLREVGIRDVSVLRGFLDRYAATMPRTMLRYSIEKLSKPERKHYLSMKSLLA